MAGRIAPALIAIAVSLLAVSGTVSCNPTPFPTPSATTTPPATPFATTTPSATPSPSALPSVVPVAAQVSCVSCHTSEAVLEALAVDEPVTDEAGGCGAPPPNIPKSQKLLVVQDFLSSVHGATACTDCHRGNDPGDMEQAHQGLVRDPSVDGEACRTCHQQTVASYATSLHNTLQGQVSAVEARSHPGIMAQELAQVNQVDCATCHATCGQCHVSRPDAVKGGLLDGHLFQETPSMHDVCVQCHGTSKEGGLYLADYGTGDVHWIEARMTCVDCHSSAEMHGSGVAYASRYEVAELPSCTDCHSQTELGGTPAHAVHQDRLSCYVCHSAGPVETCFGCHEGYEGDKRYRTSESVDYLFKIGLNPNPTERYPYAYVTVRHVPTVRDTFSDFGVELGNFDQVPTWKMSTPHNIRRVTPQNQSCASCHGHPELFLTEDDLGPADSQADRSVVVPSPPE